MATGTSAGSSASPPPPPLPPPNPPPVMLFRCELCAPGIGTVCVTGPCSYVLMTRPTALRKSALEGRGIVVLLLPSSSSSSGVVLRAVVVPHLVSRESSIHFLSLSLALSLSEKRRKRLLLLAIAVSVADVKSSVVCALSLSLSASQKVATKKVNLKPVVFSPFRRGKTLQNASFASFAFLRSTNNTEDFCTQKEDKRER